MLDEGISSGNVFQVQLRFECNGSDGSGRRRVGPAADMLNGENPGSGPVGGGIQLQNERGARGGTRRALPPGRQTNQAPTRSVNPAVPWP